MLKPFSSGASVTSSSFGRGLAKLGNSYTSHSSDDPHNKNGVNVKVILRCRPLSEMEKKDSSQFQVVSTKVEAKEVCVSQTVPGRKVDSYSKTFTFDGVCNQYTTQQELFKLHIVPIVEEVLLGFNCTIFAYGQTGTGKTYTMEGDLYSRGTCVASAQPPSQPLPGPLSARLSYSSSLGSTQPSLAAAHNLTEHAGIIPRAVQHIFGRLEAQETEYSVRVSYLEIYNEELNDLLNDGEKQNLRIYEDAGSKKGLSVDRLEEIPVNNPQDIYNILSFAVKKRRTAETLLNRQSSRSHCIFSVTIHMKEVNLDGEDVIKIGKLNLVDLAGSENIQRSGANVLKDRAKEAGMINQSLLTLGRVINALVERSSYIPYRDSKLTRLLQESLGGRTKTCIVATISPSSLCLEETLSTLDYAFRAKNIRNRPEVNQKMAKRVMIRELNHEIERLKVELLANREKNGVYLRLERYTELEARLASQETQLTNANGELVKVKAEFDATAQQLRETESHLAAETAAKVEALRDVKHLTGQLDLAASQRQLLEEAVAKLRVYEAELQNRCAALTEVLNATGEDLNTLRSEFLSSRAAGSKLIDQLSTAISASMTQLQSAAVAHLDSLAHCVKDKMVAAKASLRDEAEAALEAQDATTRSTLEPLYTHSETMQDELKLTLFQNLENRVVSYGDRLIEATAQHTQAVKETFETIQTETNSTCTRILNVSDRVAQLLQQLVTSTTAETSQHQQRVNATFDQINALFQQSGAFILKGAEQTERHVAELEHEMRSARETERNALKTQLERLVTQVQETADAILDSHETLGGSHQASFLNGCEAIRREASGVKTEMGKTLNEHVNSNLKQLQQLVTKRSMDCNAQLLSFQNSILLDADTIRTITQHHRSWVHNQCETQNAVVRFGEEEYPELVLTLRTPVLENVTAAQQHAENIFSMLTTTHQSAWKTVRGSLERQAETLKAVEQDCSQLSSDFERETASLQHIVSTGKQTITGCLDECQQASHRLFQQPEDAAVCPPPFQLHQVLQALPSPGSPPELHLGNFNLPYACCAPQAETAEEDIRRKIIHNHCVNKSQTAGQRYCDNTGGSRKGSNDLLCYAQALPSSHSTLPASSPSEGITRTDSQEDTAPTPRSAGSGVASADPLFEKPVGIPQPRALRGTGRIRRSFSTTSTGIPKSRRMQAQQSPVLTSSDSSRNVSTPHEKPHNEPSRFTSRLPRSRVPAGATPQRRAADALTGTGGCSNVVRGFKVNKSQISQAGRRAAVTVTPKSKTQNSCPVLETPRTNDDDDGVSEKEDNVIRCIDFERPSAPIPSNEG